MRRACVLGAGNSAHTTAGLIASLPGWECTVFAPHGDEAEQLLRGIQRGGIEVRYGSDDDNLVVTGTLAGVSGFAGDVVPGAEVIIMCLPALAYEVHIQAAARFVDEGAWIGTICASNAFDWCVDAAMAAVGRSPDSYGVFALQNLPWACRIAEYGVAVDVMGTKPFMELVARPFDRANIISDMMSELIRVPCPPVPGGFVGVGLSNLCQVIHPAVMHGNFKDWAGVEPFAEKPLFYQGLSQEAADNMHKVSDEIMAIRAALEARYPGLDLSLVVHIHEWTMRAYGKYIVDESTLQRRFSTNKAYAGLTCPMLPADDGGWVPNYQARYLSEDVPYNLVSVKGLALLCGVPTPTIDALVEWSQTVLGKQFLVDGQLTGKDLEESFAPQKFGFRALSDIPELRRLGA